MPRRAVRLLPLLLLALAVAHRPEAEAQPAVAAGSPGDPLARMAELERAIGAASEELEGEVARKARLDAELAGLGDQKRAARERLVRRTRGLYRLERSGLMPVAGGVQALLAHVARVERFERMVVDDLRAVRALRARGEALRAERARVDGSLELLRGRLRALEERRAGLSEEILAGRFFREGFSAFGAEPGVAAGFPAPTLAPGEAVLPVLTMRGARDRDFEGGPALALDAGAGAPVRAVGPGRVGYVGAYAELGTIVIVDHGGDRYGIYGGLGATTVRASDAVSAGTRLGSVGADGTLFFQLRQGTRALDARGWLGLR